MKNLETKKEIRNLILKKRALLTEEERKNGSSVITDKITSHPLFVWADEIFCYVSYGTEVSTHELIRRSWDTGKKVAVPKVQGKHKMSFFYIDSFEKLHPGTMGILEPVEETEPADESFEVGVQTDTKRRVLVIMPGTAFDRQGNRIGYGGGFYDVYLKQHPDYQRIAAAFQIQITDEIPIEAHDIRPDYVITEKECYKC